MFSTALFSRAKATPALKAHSSCQVETSICELDSKRTKTTLICGEHPMRFQCTKAGDEI